MYTQFSKPALGRPRRWLVAGVIALALFLSVGALTALAVSMGGYDIDGVVPDTGTFNFPDPFGAVDELGAVNASATKLGVIHTAPLPMLNFTNPNAQVDLRNIWLDTNVDANKDVWLYFAWERDSSNGSGVIMFEFQQKAAPAACDYSAVDQISPAEPAEQTLIDTCNPWANRSPGDFIIVWDQAGKKIVLILRTFKYNDTNPANGSWDGPIAEPLFLDAGVPLDSAVSAATYSADRFFGEAAINLSDTVFPPTPTACYSVANIIPGTVTGNSDTADYKDTVLADYTEDIAVSNCGEIKVIKETDPDDLSGTFPYTLKQADDGSIMYPGNPQIVSPNTQFAINSTLTVDGDYDEWTDLIAGTDYQLSEGTLASPWALQSITCVVPGSPPVSYNVFPGAVNFPIEPSTITTCTITNYQQTGTLTVIKHVINNNGGTKAAGDFTYTLPGGTTDTGAESPGKTYTYVIGTAFDITETPLTGYTPSYSGCSGTIGTTAQTCTITNDDQPGTLIVKKLVINNSGGSKVATDFSFSVNGGTPIPFVTDPDQTPADPLKGKNTLTEDAAVYTVTEPEVAGYTTTYNNCSNVTIANGGTATCTITNNDNAPTLTLVKVVTNNDGGNNLASEWTLTANSGPAGFTGQGAQDSIENKAVLGPYEVYSNYEYTLTENGPNGYLGGEWSCVINGGQPVVGATITLLEGENATCTVINNDVAPTLKLVKTVDIGDGGDEDADDWTLFATAADPDAGRNFSNLGGSGVFNTVYANAAYVLSESTVPGYTPGAWSCTGGSLVGATLTLSEGQTGIVCTIHNDDIAPTLKLVKTVDTADGGDEDANDWTLFATALAPKEGRNFSNLGGSGVFNTVYANTAYDLSESSVPGYTTGAWSCTGGSLVGATLTLSEGETGIVCTITNDDIAPTLKLVKTVDTGDGGDEDANDWTLFATAPNAGRNFSNPGGSGVFETVYANTGYVLSESTVPGYMTGAWSCTGGSLVGSTLTLSEGETGIVCTIHNDDIAPTLKLVKTVVNLYGGTNVESDWTLTANSAAGRNYSHPGNYANFEPIFANAAYTLGESGPTNPSAVYTAGNWSCDNAVQVVNGTITLGEGQTGVTCTIINYDTKAQPTGATDMSWVLHDTLDITGIRPNAPNASSATVSFSLFTDNLCAVPFGSPEVIPLTGSSASTVTGFVVTNPGTYYWRATYSGDQFNQGFITQCGYEITTIGETITPPVFGLFIPE